MRVDLSQMSLRARETLKHSALLLSSIYRVYLSAPRARSDICDMTPIASIAVGQQYPRPVLGLSPAWEGFKSAWQPAV